jgi:hypothetical protein
MFFLRRTKEIHLTPIEKVFVMLGFEVSFKDKLIHASVDNESVLGIFMDYRSNSIIPEENHIAHLGIGGLEAFEHKSWFVGHIEDVNRIVIKVIDVEQNSPVEQGKLEDRACLRKEFYTLKKELEEAGLL